MPAPDGAATHLRSHDSPASAGADAPSDAGRPYGTAHAGADAPTDVCAQPETYAPTDAAPDTPTVESAQPETDPNAIAAPDACADDGQAIASTYPGAEPSPDHAEAVVVAVAAADATPDAGAVAGARRPHGRASLRAHTQA